MASEKENLGWTGKGGEVWVQAQPFMDEMLSGFADLLCGELKESDAKTVLDIGCGTGATSLAAATCLGDKGHVTAVDISEVMLELARQRAEDARLEIDFISADAGSHTFVPNSFDHMISRFGIMFFEDPVAAFSNLRGAMKPDARLSAVVWRAREKNPFMTASFRAAAPYIADALEDMPKETGQFAMADKGLVQSILEDAGWSGIDIQPLTMPCAFDEGVIELFATRLGPVGRIVSKLEPKLRQTVTEAMVEAVRKYVSDGKVRFDAACWLVRARA